MRHPTTLIALISSSALLLSCGGGDSPTPPGIDDDGQTVTVSVTTTGIDLDADGYTVRLGNRTAAVAASGTATFDDVGAGSYPVTLEGVANNCLVEGGGSLSVSVGASSGASVSFSVDCAVDFADGVATVVCEGLSPTRASGMPLDEVDAGSVPATLSNGLAARVLDADGTDLGYTWLNVADDGAATLIVPLHPTGAASGGDVWIRVTDGVAACAPWALTIESLPAAPGEVSAVVDGLQEVVRIQAAAFETTPSDLQTTPPSALPDVLLPLAATQWVLDHPDNDESLRAFADGTAPGSLPLDLVDALVARTGLRQELSTLSNPSPRATPGPPQATTPATNCTPAAIGADTQALDQCMGARNAAAVALGDILALDAAPRLANALWLARSTPRVAQTAAVRWVLDGLAWVTIEQNARALATFPSELQPPELTVNPMRFNEDSPLIGEWSATITATSQGWQAAFANLERALAAQTLSLLIQMTGVSTDFLMRVQGLLAGPLGERLPPDLALPPETFGPVPVNDPMWSVVFYGPTTPGPSVVKVDHQRYKPFMEGPSALEVSVPQNGSRLFGDAPEQYASTQLQVDPIMLRIAPADTIIDPAHGAFFTYFFENTTFPVDSVALTVEQGTAAIGFGSGGSAAALAYTPPATASFNNPDSIHIEYTGTSGARANGGPDRSAFAIVRFGKVIITPQPACLDTQETFTFGAEVEGVDNQEVAWTAVFGTIDSNGNYQAPATRPASGLDTIKAVSVAEPQLEGEMIVPIGCTCDFQLTLGNQVIAAQAGDRMVFNTENGRLWQVTATRPSQGWTLRMLPVDDLDINSRPNAPGTWPMVIQGNMGLTGSEITYSTDPPPAATLVLETLFPNQSIQGTVNGPVEVITTSGSYPLNAEWSFAIAYPPGQFSCTVGGGP